MFDVKRFNTKSAMRDWLCGKNSTTKFKFGSTINCLIAQWAKECGMEHPSVGGEYCHDMDDRSCTSIKFRPWMRRVSMFMAGTDAEFTGLSVWSFLNYERK